MNLNKNESASALNPDKPGEENGFDRLDMKHTPGNRQDELKSLQERFELHKKDPAATPWESAFDKLIHPSPKSGSDVC